MCTCSPNSKECGCNVQWQGHGFDSQGRQELIILLWIKASAKMNKCSINIYTIYLY